MGLETLRIASSVTRNSKPVLNVWTESESFENIARDRVTFETIQTFV